MKKFLFIVALMLPLSTSMLLAQSSAPKTTKIVTKKVVKKENADAPIAVKDAFKKRFPKVTKVRFEKEKNGEYEAGFKVSGMAMSANFTADGTWRETESEIGAAALPATIKQSIAAKYPRAQIVGGAKIETSDKGTLYEADLKTGLKKSEVVFDENGNVLSN